jgi:hypothetical protein
MGFYPTPTGFLPGVGSKGVIKDDSGDSYNKSYTINVTASQFNAALSGVINDNTNASYILSNLQLSYSEYNCTDAAISWMNDAGQNFKASASGAFVNTPGNFGQALDSISGVSATPGKAPQGHGPCN